MADKQTVVVRATIKVQIYRDMHIKAANLLEADAAAIKQATADLEKLNSEINKIGNFNVLSASLVEISTDGPQRSLKAKVARRHAMEAEG